MSEAIPMYFEPWQVDDDDPHGIVYVVDTNGALIVGDVLQRNAARIVACVNACAGIEDPEGAIEKARTAAWLLRDLICSGAIEWSRVNRATVISVAANSMGALGLPDSALSALTPKEKK